MTLPQPGRFVEALASLARHLTEGGRHVEAVDALSLAVRLAPDDAEIRRGLAVARRRLAGARARRRPAEKLRETLRRDAIDATQFVGLARLHIERGETSEALATLEEARRRSLASPGLEILEASVHVRRDDLESASRSLARAVRLDPFDRAAAEQMSDLEFDCRRYREALERAVDAYLLTPKSETEACERLRRRLRTLRQLLGWSTAQTATLFHERQEELGTAFDRLAWRRDSMPPNIEEAVEDLLGLPVEPQPNRSSGRISFAARLRRMAVLAGLSDEQLFLLTRVVREEFHTAGSQILSSASPEIDLYVIESGEVAVRRTTPYGVYPLATLAAGEIIGEVNFITRQRRSGEVVATRATRLLRLEGDGLDRLIADHADLGAQIYWTLWHALAAKLRATNDQLRTFFHSDSTPENFVRLRRAPDALVGKVKVDVIDKIRLFREQGLTGQEMEALAAFSRERRYAAGSFIFHENDAGREMYVVLEGQVRISKSLAGGGEEALAILERGDFFGEMSLIDGQPRSADARAHSAPVTILVLDQAAVSDVLALDPRASLEFLKLLCRLIAKRLREIDEKITTWRILVSQAGSEIA